MGTKDGLGSFEHMVMLAVLKLGDEARALDIRKLLEEEAERTVSRGALYATLERLEGKGLVSWNTEETSPGRGGIPRRVFEVTEGGLGALRHSHRVLSRLSAGLNEALG